MEYDYTLNERIVTKYTNVRVLNQPFYTTQFSLDSVQVTMEVGYDPRYKMRWIILKSLTGVLLLKQTYIKNGRRCELNFNSNLYDLDYYVTVIAKDDHFDFESIDYLNWADDLEICFVGYRYKFQEELDLNYRIDRVGN